MTIRRAPLPLLVLACASAAQAATIPPCGPVDVIAAQPVALAAASVPSDCDRSQASAWTIDGDVQIWRCALTEIEGQEPEEGAQTHALFITRAGQLVHRGPDVPNLLGAAGLAVVRADLSGDGQAETVIAAHESESQGMGVNRWTLSVFAPDWTFLGSRTEVADWGPGAFVPRAWGARGCALLITEWREVEKADGSVVLYFTGIRADVGGEIPRLDTGPGLELAMRRYDRRFEAQRTRDINRARGPLRDPLAWLAPQIAAGLAEEARDAR